MKRRIGVAPILLGVLVAATEARGGFRSPFRKQSFSSLHLLRGGGSAWNRYYLHHYSDLIELNPDYVGYEGNKSNGGNSGGDPLVQETMDDLERGRGGGDQRHPSSYFHQIEQTQSFIPTTLGEHNQQRLTLFQLIHQHGANLYQTSPSLFATTAACLVVFCSWQLVPSSHGILQRHFVTSRSNLRAGRWGWTGTLLSTLSHSSPMHLIFNLMALLTFGPKVQRVLQSSYPYSHRGQWPLWPLLTGAALTGSIAFLITSPGGACMGLSDVTMALLAVYARCFPDRVLGILVAGIVPVRMTAQELLQLSLVWSAFGTLLAIRHRPQRIAHSAHLGGLLFGLGYYEAWRRRLQWQKVLQRATKLGKRL